MASRKPPDPAQDLDAFLNDETSNHSAQSSRHELDQFLAQECSDQYSTPELISELDIFFEKGLMGTDARGLETGFSERYASIERANVRRG